MPKPGIEIVVDYAANGNVCRIQLPPVAPSADSRVITPQAIDDFLTELIRPSLRGKELRRFAMVSGLVSIVFAQYENVTISESFQGTERTRVTVLFPKDDCRDHSND